jgi:hypothetical protein
MGVSLCSYVAFGALEAGYLAAAVDEDQVEVSLTVAAMISISSPANVSLGTINGTGQSVTSSADFNVITNNTSGYRFDIKASSSPAMRCSSGGCAVNSDSFADYTPATADVPETWSVAASASEFGISASGTAASAIATAWVALGTATSPSASCAKTRARARPGAARPRAAAAEPPSS